MFFGEKMGLGYSLMTGALTLIIMVLPLITRNTQEALKTVPNTYRNGAIGLGSGKWHMIRTILIPSAMPGIITGTILAVGRIVGESAALLFTAGSAKQLSNGIKGLLDKPFQSGGTLTIQMYLSATSEGDFETAFGIAVVLLITKTSHTPSGPRTLKTQSYRQLNKIRLHRCPWQSHFGCTAAVFQRTDR